MHFHIFCYLFFSLLFSVLCSNTRLLLLVLKCDRSWPLPTQLVIPYDVIFKTTTTFYAFLFCSWDVKQKKNKNRIHVHDSLFVFFHRYNIYFTSCLTLFIFFPFSHNIKKYRIILTISKFYMYDNSRSLKPSLSD